jgi:hypothetical protein
MSLIKLLQAGGLALALTLGGAAVAAGDAGMPAPKPPVQAQLDKSPRCEPAKVNECRTTCDRKKYEATGKDDLAKKQYECKQDCIRGC